MFIRPSPKELSSIVLSKEKNAKTDVAEPATQVGKPQLIVYKIS